MLGFYPYGGRLLDGFPCAAPFGEIVNFISISAAPIAVPGNGLPAEKEKFRYAAVGAGMNFSRKPERKSRFPFLSGKGNRLF